jgi:hypothetical protein
MEKKLITYYYVITGGEYFNHYIAVKSENKEIADKFADHKLKDFDYKNVINCDGVHMGTLIQYKEDFYTQHIFPKFSL